MRKLFLFTLFVALLTSFSCRKRDAEYVSIALPEKFTTFDTLTTEKSDAMAERVKNLIFNTLIRKDPNFNYIGELAKEITTSPDGVTITFRLQDGVKFHNGKEFTSADVKYTFDELFKSKGFKSFAFYDSVPEKSESAKPATAAPSANVEANANPVKEVKTKQVAHIEAITTPDAKTVVFKIARPSLKNQLLANLVAVPIIPEGTAAQQKDAPVGSGPFKFVTFDASQNILDLAGNPEYWEGAPKITKLRVKTVTDANSLQAELATGGVDIAANPSNLPPDTIKSLGNNPNLRVEQSEGSNIQYLVFNTQPTVLNNPNPLSNPKIRQAIGYAIDRQKIVTELLAGQAKVANSILPTQSWAYTPGTEYKYDPVKVKQLLQEAGYKNEPIVFKFGSGNLAVSQYAQVIQSSLADAGLNVQIETLEINTIRQQLAQGQFQIYTGIWVGGNQDPIFLRDLFTSEKIPGGAVSCCNRSRYINELVDKNIAAAILSADQEKAKELYAQSWSSISNDLPLLPLWYPANIVITTKRIGNVKINASGDWGFVKDVTVTN